MFPDVGSNSVVISLQEGPLVDGDVKVMFESSAVSVIICLMLVNRSLIPIQTRNGSLWTVPIILRIYIPRVCLKDMKTVPSTFGSTPPL